MASNAPEEVTQTSSDDDAGDIDDTSNLAQAEVIIGSGRVKPRAPPRRR